MRAHDFTPTPDGDDQCERCKVTVAPPVHMTFTVSCPAGDCTSANNPDRGCVFVKAPEVGSRCLFCGRTGGHFPIPENTPELEV